MTQDCILAIDQGTTSSRAMVFDAASAIVSSAQAEFPQHYPAPGWVEHDPEDIWLSTLHTARQAFNAAESKGKRVVAIGITNQRETTVLWERDSGKPLHNAIVWQDRRTADVCHELAKQKLDAEVSKRTGLLLDPYFSATKIAWLLDHINSARRLAQAGKLAFGTVDSFLVSRLTGSHTHVTDASNAARTCLFNIKTQRWDEALLRIFDVPPGILPRVLDSSAAFGETRPELFGRALPILGVAGDQQAATLGQCCFAPGDIKSTYGTGCFVMLNTGEQALQSQHRLLTTIAWRLNGKTTYALEGSIFIAGAAVQWLRDGLGIINSASETQKLAMELVGNNGVYMVPAFTGLGAPYWQPDVRGAIFGITRATGAAELARAALEAVCYQTHDLLTAMAHDGVAPASLRVDGGMVGNHWLMQFLADILDIPVERPQVMETTALGAAYLAGMQAGVYGSFDELAAQRGIDRQFKPQIDAGERQKLLGGWQDALQRVIGAPRAL